MPEYVADAAALANVPHPDPSELQAVGGMDAVLTTIVGVLMRSKPDLDAYAQRWNIDVEVNPVATLEAKIKALTYDLLIFHPFPLIATIAMATANGDMATANKDRNHVHCHCQR